ncbi:MAG: DUF4178 domain-containing protein [Comamonas sp.]
MTRDQQRSYTAPCPGCGAPVEFASAQSAYAVCPYCHSAIVRNGEVLKRLGRMAEIFENYSPLKIGQTGQLPADDSQGSPQGFTLVGRLQLKGDTGLWNEWQALLDDGEIAVLSEDNGQFVLSREYKKAARNVPGATVWKLGQSVTISEVRYTVASVVQAQLMAAEGQMAHQPELGKPFTVVELRNEQDELLSIDYSEAAPAIYRGRPVALADLKIAGLDKASAKKEKGRHFNCPQCAARIEVKLQTTQSLTCPSCGSLIDVSGGIGGELRAALQDEPVEPLIALGRIGKFGGASWQVVGFQHRMGVEAGDDEHFGWDEYLLFHKHQGFQFLVSASDGWSLVKVITGAPTYQAGKATATYQKKKYTQQSAYRAETTYVLGEFYWPVVRGQRTDNIDFAAGQNLDQLLSREEDRGREVTWSQGRKLPPEAVAAAFGMIDQLDKFRNTSVLDAFKGRLGGKPLWIGLVVLALLVFWLWPKGCDASAERLAYANDPNYVSKCSSTSGSRSSGGSWGGYSSGGSHK